MKADKKTVVTVLFVLAIVGTAVYFLMRKNNDQGYRELGSYSLMPTTAGQPETSDYRRTPVGNLSSSMIDSLGRTPASRQKFAIDVMSDHEVDNYAEVTVGLVNRDRDWFMNQFSPEVYNEL